MRKGRVIFLLVVAATDRYASMGCGRERRSSRQAHIWGFTGNPLFTNSVAAPAYPRQEREESVPSIS
jgi:hypothetical protein